MKTRHTLLLLALGATGLCTSCVSEDRELATPQTEQTGQLRLKLSAASDFSAQTRALNEADYRNTDRFTVQLVNLANSDVLLECKGSELEANLPKELEIGSYEVKAFYGTESAASRSDFRVEGSSTFTIQASKVQEVGVHCEPTCGKLLVAFSDDMADYYDDYSVSYTGTSALAGNSVAWAKTDTEPWYVKLGESGETLTYTVSVTAKADYAHVDAEGNLQTSGTATGTFELQRNRAHKLTVRPNYSPTSEGGLSLSIHIDESTNDKPVTIEVPVSWI